MNAHTRYARGNGRKDNTFFSDMQTITPLYVIQHICSIIKRERKAFNQCNDALMHLFSNIHVRASELDEISVTLLHIRDYSAPKKTNYRITYFSHLQALMCIFTEFGEIIILFGNLWRFCSVICGNVKNRVYQILKVDKKIFFR